MHKITVCRYDVNFTYIKSIVCRYDVRETEQARISCMLIANQNRVSCIIILVSTVHHSHALIGVTVVPGFSCLSVLSNNVVEVNDFSRPFLFRQSVLAVIFFSFVVSIPYSRIKQCHKIKFLK